jgi:hypothetical protein
MKKISMKKGVDMPVAEDSTLICRQGDPENLV